MISNHLQGNSNISLIFRNANKVQFKFNNDNSKNEKEKPTRKGNKLMELQLYWNNVTPPQDMDGPLVRRRKSQEIIEATYSNYHKEWWFHNFINKRHVFSKKEKSIDVKYFISIYNIQYRLAL